MDGLHRMGVCRLEAASRRVIEVIAMIRIC
jgi:hypothetical protein